MLPDSVIQAFDPRDWKGRRESTDIVGVHPAYFERAVRVHNISFQRIAGRWLYYRPDCEAAALKVAAMRAERGAKPQEAA